MYSLNCDGDNVLVDQVRTGVQDDCRCCSVDGRNLHDTCPKQVDPAAVQNSRSFPCGGQRSVDGHYNTWPKHAVVYAVHDARQSTSRYQRNEDEDDRGPDDDKPQGVRFAWPNYGDTSQQSLDTSYDNSSKQTNVYAVQEAWESSPGYQGNTTEEPLDGRFDGGSEQGIVHVRASTSGYQ